MIEALQARLAAREPITRAEWDARPAAVLVPLYEHAGEWWVLLTRRTDKVDSHKGQVAFPGGRVDPEDASLVHTALREAHEEIGLRPGDATVIGRLDELITVTQYRVTPIVARIPYPYDFVPSADEIDAIFGAPLRWLADPANLETRYREPLVSGPKIPVYYWHYGEYTIWGATARMLLNLLDVARPLPGGQPPD